MVAYAHITVAGNVGADPETRKAGRNDVCSFSVAVNRKVGGEDKTNWFRAVIWNERLIEVAEKYVKKGDPILIAGDINIAEWEGRDGKMTTVEVNVFQLQLLGQREGAGGSDRRGSDRRDDRGGGRDDRGRGRDDDRRGGGRDDRRASNGRDRDDRGRDDDRRGGGRDERGGGRQQDDDLNDAIPF
jgi:single-strand DNA-binding protein